MTDTDTVAAFEETKPIPLDSAGRPVGADGIPLSGPGRAQVLAERAEAESKAAAKAARDAAKLKGQASANTDAKEA